MGSHDETHAKIEAVKVDGLETLSLQVWQVLGGSQVAVWGSYKTAEGPTSAQLGSIHLSYHLLSFPSLGQVLWTLGDELRHNYRDLSKP